MIFDSFIDKAKEEVEKSDVEKKRCQNYEYIVNNKDYLINNFPNHWIVIKNQSVFRANHDFDYMLMLLKNSGDLSSDMLFVFGHEYRYFVMGEFNG